MKTQVLIPAAGRGLRLGAEMPKALVTLAGKPLIQITLERMGPLIGKGSVIVVYPEGYEKEFAEALAPLKQKVLLVIGGEERQDSVQRGLEALDNDTDIVIIHDAARPFAPIMAIRAAIEAAGYHGAATLAIPVADTMLLGNDRGFLESTPDRSLMWACQTPQVFKTDIIKGAYALAGGIRNRCTDDATLARLAGVPVKLVQGDAVNLKITTPRDISYAEYLLRQGLV